MDAVIYVPDSLRSGGRQAHCVLAGPLDALPKPSFVCA
jgi:hypothetical protein